MKKIISLGLFTLVSTFGMAHAQQMPSNNHTNMMMVNNIEGKNADINFVKGMIEHHKGAVTMSQQELKYGKDPEMRRLAQSIIKAQQQEIKMMERWLQQHPAK